MNGLNTSKTNFNLSQLPISLRRGCFIHVNSELQPSCMPSASVFPRHLRKVCCLYTYSYSPFHKPKTVR